MNKWLSLLLLTLLCGCFTRSAYITQEKFNNVQVGEPIATVVKEAGEPYSIRKKSAGVEEYTYVESITTGARLVYENHYVFIVKDGRVVGKRIGQEREPGYEMMYQDDPNHYQFPKK